MTWTWQFEKADGTLVPSRGAAEGDVRQPGRRGELARRELARACWRRGVDQVTLLEDGRVEYGPMSLHPEQPGD